MPIRSEGSFARAIRRLVLGLAACLFFPGSVPLHAKTLGELLVELGYQPVKMHRGADSGSLGGNLASENLWLVDAKFNGRSRRALVDTGASICAVDKGIAAKLPRVGSVEIASVPPMKRELVSIEQVQLGGTVITNVRAGVADLSLPSQGRVPTGSHIELNAGHEAILGKEFLERSHAILHVAASTLYLRPDAPTARQTNLLARTLVASGMTNVPLAELDRHSWGVPAKFDGHPTTLILDTGASASRIDSATAKTWNITGKHTQIESRGTDKRKAESMVTRVDLLEVCGCRLINFPLVVGDLSLWGLGAKAESGAPVAGLMGNDILARANAIFDCHTGSLWVVPKTIKE